LRVVEIFCWVHADPRRKKSLAYHAQTILTRGLSIGAREAKGGMFSNSRCLSDRLNIYSLNEEKKNE